MRQSCVLRLLRLIVSAVVLFFSFFSSLVSCLFFFFISRSEGKRIRFVCRDLFDWLLFFCLFPFQVKGVLSFVGKDPCRNATAPNAKPSTKVTQTKRFFRHLQLLGSRVGGGKSSLTRAMNHTAVFLGVAPKQQQQQHLIFLIARRSSPSSQTNLLELQTR